MTDSGPDGAPIGSSLSPSRIARVRDSLRAIILAILLAILVVFYRRILALYLGSDLRLDLGSINLVSPRLVVVWNAYALWGTLALVLLFKLLPRALDGRVRESVDRHPGWTLLILTALCGAASAFVRYALLDAMPLTDDESAYRFAAETLASGHLSIEAPPLGLFLDRAFAVVNDRMYTAYFLGWPAILALSGMLGLDDVAGCLFAGMSVFPLALILSKFSRRSITAAGLGAYACSFMVLVMGATLLAHSACTFFLLCFVERCLHILTSVRPTATDGVLCAAAICVAFFIRPATSVAIATPFLCWLAATALRNSSRVATSAVAFAVMALAGAALFFFINQSLYGGWFESGYSNYLAYMEAIGRNEFGPQNPPIMARVHMVLSHADVQFELLSAGISRLSHDFLGWPVPVIVLAGIAVIWDRRLWPFVTGVFFLIAVHALILDFGIDSFGPNHLYEAGPFLIVLWCAACEQLVRRGSVLSGRSIFRWKLEAIAPHHVVRTTIALSLCGWLFYFPLRAENIRVMVRDIERPLRAAEELQGPALVLAPQARIGNQVGIQPLRHFVFYMPFNDIHLRKPILWFREAEDEATNAALMSKFPERIAYRLRWDLNGSPVFQRLDGGG